MTQHEYNSCEMYGSSHRVLSMSCDGLVVRQEGYS
jgi:hypothetical protein